MWRPFFGDQIITSKSHQKTLEQARAALAPIDPARSNATAGIDPQLDLDGSFLILPIDAIEIYRHNPRSGPNPNYEQIKDSIRADGITNMLSVTRRDPGSKYTLYGGGNTRLKIAKELYAEGDKRFADLRVVYKTWPGDAQVITAHLVENENRGDISFWEKAKGVESFKREFEQEQEQVLTAGSLNRELRKRGLNYGVRTLQNFAFAVENFAAIGPWLKPTFLNETLRPAYAALENLGARLLGNPTPVKMAMDEAMTEIGARLHQLDGQNRDLDPQDRQPVQLDEADLVQALHEAAAGQLEVSRMHLDDMLRVLQNNPKIDAEGLRQLCVEPDADQVSPQPVASVPEISPSAPVQPPLGRMLADVSKRDVATPADATASNETPGEGREQPPAAIEATSDADDVTAQLEALIRQQMSELVGLAPLQDVALFAKNAPFFYVMELPPEGFSQYLGDDLPQEDALLRGALWRSLAAFSLQFDTRVAALMGRMDGTRWAAAWSAGPQAFRKQCQEVTGLQIDAQGQPLSAMADMARILQRPEISYPFMRIVGYSIEVRLRLPDRVPHSFQSVFAAPPETQH